MVDSTFHGICGDLEDPDSDDPLRRICAACLTRQASSLRRVHREGGESQSGGLAPAVRRDRGKAPSLPTKEKFHKRLNSRAHDWFSHPAVVGSSSSVGSIVHTVVQY